MHRLNVFKVAITYTCPIMTEQKDKLIMATNVVIDGEDIMVMDGEDLCAHLSEQGFPDEAVSVIKGTLRVVMVS